MTLFRLERVEETGSVSGMARGAGRVDEREQRIGVAIGSQLDYTLHVAAGSALVPELLPAAAPKPGGARLEREAHRLSAHPGDHEHLARIVLLHHAGDEAMVVKSQVIDVHQKSNLTGMPWAAMYSFTWRIE